METIFEPANARGWTARSFILLHSFVSLLGCPRTSQPGEEEGCSKDTDCKGMRVCEQRQCIERPSGEFSGATSAEVPAGQEAPPRAGQWFRGGPGGASPRGAKGPTRPPRLLWEVDLGGVVFAAPTLLEHEGQTLAFVGAHSGRLLGVVADGEGRGSTAFELTLGGMIWGTAAVGENGRVYVGTDDDMLHAIDPSSASIVWSLRIGACKETRSPGPEGARCDPDGGPTIGPSGDLFLGADGLYRITPDGAIRWHYPSDTQEVGRHVFSTPMVLEDESVVFGGQDAFITMLTAMGTLRWRYRVGADVDGSAAMGRHGTIYIGGDDGRVHALGLDGTLRWAFVTNADIRSAIAVSDNGSIYASSFDGNLYALSLTGQPKWALPVGTRMLSSPVVDAAGNLFFGSQDDHVYAVSPAGKVLWTYDLGADVDSSVAITRAGVLVVGADDGRVRGLK